jgi:hypothetical protein
MAEEMELCTLFGCSYQHGLSAVVQCFSLTTKPQKQPAEQGDDLGLVSDSDDGGCRAGATLRLSLVRLAHASPSTKLCSTTVLYCSEPFSFLYTSNMNYQERSQVRMVSL